MADKVTFDFENNIVEFDTESQKGTEYSEGLKEKKEAILKAAGYEITDMTDVIEAINDMLNRRIGE